MSGRRRSFLKLVALGLVAITGSAQSPSTQVQQTKNDPTAPKQEAQKQQAAPSDVTIKSRAQVVLLDVVATDHKGRPITDLKQEDFSVSEKGVPQPIASFSMMDIAKRKAMPAGATEEKLPPGVYSNRTQAVASEDQLIVLLLDALNTPWADQQYMRLQMLKYLAKNHQKGQRMAIFGLARTLIRLQDFTDDPEKLVAVIKKQKGEQSPLLDTDEVSPMAMDSMTEDMQQAVQSFQEQSAAMQTDMRVRMTMDALKAIGRMLQGYPGRKKLLWVSGSFPINLSPGEVSGFDSQRSYGDDIFQTTSLLRESQVAVYPIDPSGLETLSVFNASNPSMGRSRATSGGAFNAAISRQTQAIAARHFAASKVADETGGVAFYNRNDLDTAVMKSVADGAIYYALSYSPTDKNWNGQFRRIDVKVNRPDVVLRYRKGYNAVDPDAVREAGKAQVNQDIGSALNTVLSSSAVTFYGSAQPLKAPAQSGHAVNEAAIKLADVRFLVAPEDVMFHPEGEKKHCSLEFVAADFAGDRQLKTATQELNCNVDDATYAKLLKAGLVFRLPLEVAAGSTRIRLLVRDNLTGKMGTLDVPYALAAAHAPAPLQPPKP